MIPIHQDEVNQGANLIALLIKSLVEVNDGRLLNEQDDLLIAAAVVWIDEYSEIDVEEIEITEH
jgi:hypothetical protein|tara:strand:+ start:386 stop:577 length:192 start_codon:yes stop_codon:yes gene_type:complete